MQPKMSVEAERFDPSKFVPPWVVSEHVERYKFASTFVRDVTVVDCACGTGEGTRLYAESGATLVYAYDISTAAIEDTARKCSSKTNVRTAFGSALDLPLAAGSADLFVSLETFEHLTSQTGFLDEVVRVLRPGGIFLCSTPNRDVYSPGNQQASKPWNKYHTCEYNKVEFLDALNARFVETKLFGQNPVNHAIEWIANGTSQVFGLTPAVRLKQLLKLPRFVIPRRRERHAVVPAADGQSYEYLVAVSRTPELRK